MYDFSESIVQQLTHISQDASVGFRKVIVLTACLLMLFALIGFMERRKQRHDRWLNKAMTLFCLGLGCALLAWMLYHISLVHYD